MLWLASGARRLATAARRPASTWASWLTTNLLPAKAVQPPVPRPHLHVAPNGRRWQDEWAHLNALTPETLALLSAEDAATRAFLADTATLQVDLVRESWAHSTSGPAPAADPWGDFEYYMAAGTTFCRRRRAADGSVGPEQVIVDAATPWKHGGREGDALTGVRLSRDAGTVAYVLVSLGGDFTGHVADVATGAARTAPIPGAQGLEFDASGARVLYVTATPGGGGRPARVLCRPLGPAAAAADVLLFSEPDPRFYVSIQRSKDWRLLFLTATSKAASRVGALDASSRRPFTAEDVVEMCPKESRVSYYPESAHGWVYLLAGSTAGEDTDSDALHGATVELGLYRIRADRLDRGRGSWAAVLPATTTASRGVTWHDVDVSHRHLVLYGRCDQDSRPRVAVLPLPKDPAADVDPSGLQLVPLPAWAMEVTPGPNMDFASSTLRVSLGSPVVPTMSCDIDLHSLRITPLGSPGAMAPPSRYMCTRTLVPSADGTTVPLTVAHVPGLVAPRPTVLHAYGAYGQCPSLEWDDSLGPLLDRGWVLAWAHVRGGGELGRAWHAAATGVNKFRSVEDLEACMAALCDRGLTTPDHLALRGGSAGGMLLAAVANRGVQRCAALLARVPFVDPLLDMCDDGLPLTRHEVDEWGDTARDDVFQALASLSPYQNIPQAGGWRPPAVLASAGLQDALVLPSQPLKWVQRLRARSTHPAPPILLAVSDNGHQGEGGAVGPLKEAAREHAFLVKVMHARGIVDRDGRPVEREP